MGIEPFFLYVISVFWNEILTFVFLLDLSTGSDYRAAQGQYHGGEGVWDKLYKENFKSRVFSRLRFTSCGRFIKICLIRAFVDR